MTLVVTTPAADVEKLTALCESGIELLTVSADDSNQVDIRQLLKVLGQRQISSVLVEGGGEIITSFLRLGLADRLVVFTAPRIMGRGVEAVGELEIKDVAGALKLTFERVYRSAEDVVIEARVG